MSDSIDPVDSIPPVDPVLTALPEPEEDETLSTPPSTPPADPLDFSPETPIDDPVEFQDEAEVETHPVVPSELTGMLEALLFVCDAPTARPNLPRRWGDQRPRFWPGWRICRSCTSRPGGGCVCRSATGAIPWSPSPQAAGVIEAFLNLDLSSHLSAPALEALAIVAYRQPVTKAQVEAVRGVDCGGVLRTLLQRGLIEDVGRLETVGRPILYGVTDFFMQHFGLENMQELPPLPSTDADTLWAATELAEE